MRRARAAGAASWAVLLCAAASSVLALPEAPENCRAFPDYVDDSIVVEWDDVEFEDGYRVFRAEAVEGPFDPVSPDLAPDTTSWTDPGRDPAAEYFYLVRAFDVDGESEASNVFQQNVKVIWPNPGNHSLLHNWNELIGSAAEDGYHRGCDIQQIGPEANTIVYQRGGVVARVGVAGNDNVHVYVEVRTPEGLRYDSFNHLGGKKVTALGVDIGDCVRAGQEVQVIGQAYYTIGYLDFIDHVHFFSPTDPWTGDVDGQHPLKIFSAEIERDPGTVRPSVHDHGLLSDGPVLYHRQDSAPGPPYLTLPLGDDPATADLDEGNVDIHVEIADLMGLGTTAVPMSVAWWIEGRPCDGSPAVVKNAATPYMLVRWDDQMFRGTGVFWWRVADQAQDLAPYISHEGSAYPLGWHNFKHFILTNTHGTDGDHSRVDEAQYWNTNAADDGSPHDGPAANFAGLPDAGRAAEARFPDGDYTVHVTTTDLIGSHDNVIPGIRLDNFPPAVAEHAFNGTDHFFLRFSEPMDTTAVESALEVWRSGIGPVSYATAWEGGDCRVDLQLDMPVETCPQYSFRLDATIASDLEGRLLDSSYDSLFHDGLATGSQIDTVVTLHSTDGVLEVGDLRVDPVATATVRLTWPAAGSAESYSITRGLLSTLTTGQYGPCLASGLTLTEYDDSEPAPLGDGFFYLVRGSNQVCGPGPLARDSSGADRVNEDPLACW